jgi:hypothetical protein
MRTWSTRCFWNWTTCPASTICALHVQEEFNDRFVACAIGMIGELPPQRFACGMKINAGSQRHPYYARVCLRGTIFWCDLQIENTF